MSGLDIGFIVLRQGEEAGWSCGGGFLISKTGIFTRLNPTMHETDKKADCRTDKRNDEPRHTSIYRERQEL